MTIVMSVTVKAKAAYEQYQKYEKIKGHYDTAKGYYISLNKILNEETRSEEYFKLGLKGLMKLGEKVVGKSLTNHPYYVFHKPHFEILGQALTATAKHDAALKAMSAAVASADATEALAKQISDYKHAKNLRVLVYAQFMQHSLHLLRNHGTRPAQVADQNRKKTGMSPDELRTLMDRYVYEWRAQVCELYFDSTELFVMVDIKYRAAVAAHKKYQGTIQKLQQSSKPIDRLAGYGAEQKRMWELYDRDRNQMSGRSGSSSPEAVKDPMAYAGRQRDSVGELVGKLAAFCDVAMSPAAYDPELFHSRIGSL